MPEFIANPVVAKTRRKTKPSASASLRVWRLHENMNHTALTTLAIMVQQIILRNAYCTAVEILLVETIKIVGHVRLQSGRNYPNK